MGEKIRQIYRKYRGQAVTCAAAFFVLVAGMAVNLCIYPIWGYEGEEELPERLKEKC